VKIEAPAILPAAPRALRGGIAGWGATIRSM